MARQSTKEKDKVKLHKDPGLQGKDRAFKTEDGCQYEGQMVGDIKHGKGKFTYRDGSYYDGEWKCDHANGTGVYRCIGDDGNYFSTYTGPWVDDIKEGKGKEEYEDGSNYN